MRISDWSSDVCSSDLEADVAAHVLEPRFVAVLRADRGQLVVAFAEAAGDDGRRGVGNLHGLGHLIRSIAAAGEVEHDGFSFRVERRHRQPYAGQHISRTSCQGEAGYYMELRVVD